MTDNHPVTKGLHCNHECVCPDYKAAHSENGEEECYGDPEPCKLSCYHRSRPDPLALLEVWRNGKDSQFSYNGTTVKVWEIDEMIKKLRTNPEAVRQQGIKEGWWK